MGCGCRVGCLWESVESGWMCREDGVWEWTEGYLYLWLSVRVAGLSKHGPQLVNSQNVEGSSMFSRQRSGSHNA